MTYVHDFGLTRARRLLVVAFVMAASLASAATFAPSSQANTDIFSNWLWLQPQQQYAGPSVSWYRLTEVRDNDWVGAGAHLSGGWTMYGSYITGWLYACHDYAVGNTLGGMAKNDSGLYGESVYGGYTYGQGITSHC